MGKEIKDSYLIEIGYWVDYEKKIFKRNVLVPNIFADKIINERIGNKGIFKSVYTYDTTIPNESYLYGDFYLDFDNDDYNKVKEDALSAINTIRSVFTIAQCNIKIYYSGNKGIHLIVDKSIFGIKPDKKLNVVYKYIANIIKEQTVNKSIDLQIYDNKRLFRVANTIHEKSGLYKTQISFNELKTLDEFSIREIASKQRDINYARIQANDIAHKMFYKIREKALEEFNSIATEEHENNTKKIIRDIPPCVKNILDVGPIDGTRNQTLSALTSFYKSKGCSYNEALSLVLEWNSGAMPYNELKATFNSIYKSNFKYGCRTFKGISQCDYGKCPLMKGKNVNVQNNKIINS